MLNTVRLKEYQRPTVGRSGASLNGCLNGCLVARIVGFILYLSMYVLTHKRRKSGGKIHIAGAAKTVLCFTLHKPLNVKGSHVGLGASTFKNQGVQ